MSKNQAIPPTPLDQAERRTKNWLLITYIWLGLSLFYTSSSIIAILVIVILKDDIKRSRFIGHSKNILLVVLAQLSALIVGAIILADYLFGFQPSLLIDNNSDIIDIARPVLTYLAIYFLIGCWALYRIVKGIIKLSSNKSFYKSPSSKFSPYHSKEN